VAAVGARNMNTQADNYHTVVAPGKTASLTDHRYIELDIEDNILRVGDYSTVNPETEWVPLCTKNISPRYNMVLSTLGLVVSLSLIQMMMSRKRINPYSMLDRVSLS
jgi:hypothetical protein